MNYQRCSLESIALPPNSEERLLSEYERDHKSTSQPARGGRLRLYIGFFLGLLSGTSLVGLPWLYTNICINQELSYQISGEINGLVPNFPIQKVKFDADHLATIDHKTEESQNATRENWLSYMPVGNGFTNIEDITGYELPPPMKNHDADVYSFAFTHQLHCLYSIMTTYNGLLDGSADRPTTFEHIDHCFRYLRQSILCCGDTALEGQNPRKSSFGTDGTGAIHLCKNWDQLYSWVEGRRINDNKVI